MFSLTISYGSSMLPTFGKLNLIAILKKTSYKKNDIIAFKGNNNKSYTHRIIFINSDYFTTKGDNLPIQNYEKGLPIKNIEGKIYLILRIIK